MQLKHWVVVVAVGAFMLTLLILAARQGAMGTIMSPAALFGKQDTPAPVAPLLSASPSPNVQSTQPAPVHVSPAPHIQVVLLCDDATAAGAAAASRTLYDTARARESVVVHLVQTDAIAQARVATFLAQTKEQLEFTLVTHERVRWHTNWDTHLLNALEVAGSGARATLVTGIAPGFCSATAPPAVHSAPALACVPVPLNSAVFYEPSPAISLACLFGTTAVLRTIPYITGIATAEEELLAYVLHARLSALNYRIVALHAPPMLRDDQCAPSTPHTRSGNATLLSVLARFAESGAAPAAALLKFQQFAGVPSAELHNVHAPPPW